ncbi:MAG: DUF47 family protein [Steroidobacteraceae bacterium]
MNFIARLMPREGQFFTLFNEHAGLVRDGGGAVVDLITHYGDEIERSRQIDRIQSIEHRADRVTHETIQLLHRTFVTPFDRDDIHRLISRMDDVLDLIQDTGESMVLYDIRTLTPEVGRLAECLRRCCERINDAVQMLATMAMAPDILKICQEIDGLESDADRIMRAAISSLFRNEQDTRQLIKLKAVYESLEAATDKCQDVANLIESLVLENA